MKFTVIHAPSGDVNGKGRWSDDEKKKQGKIKGHLFLGPLQHADLDDEGVRGILQSLRKPPKDGNEKCI